MEGRELHKQVHTRALPQKMLLTNMIKEYICIFHLWLLIAFWLPVLYCLSAGCWHILYSCLFYLIANKKLLSMRSKDRLNGLKKLTGE